jgi:hypothetical protein
MFRFDVLCDWVVPHSWYDNPLDLFNTQSSPLTSDNYHFETTFLKLLIVFVFCLGGIVQWILSMPRGSTILQTALLGTLVIFITFSVGALLAPTE